MIGKRDTGDDGPGWRATQGIKRDHWEKGKGVNIEDRQGSCE
jgi:hypothetical protein